MAASNQTSASGAPVLQLPPELLLLVFSVLEELIPVTKKGRYTSCWIAATQVRRKWRNTALAWPHLWRRIPLSRGAKIVDEFIRRSKDMPFIFDEDFENEFRHLKRVLQPAIMARTCELHLPINIFHPEVQSILRRPAPRLQALVLNHLKYDFYSSGVLLVMPENLFGGDAPLLRIFKATALGRWPLFPSLFAGLRHFEISDFVLQSSQRLWEMLDSLQCMPLLEHLCFSRIEIKDCNPYRAPDPVSLPHLQKLVLENRVLISSMILSSLSVPPQCKMWIEFDKTHCDENGLAHIPTLIANICASGFDVEFAPRALAIDITDEQLSVAASMNPLSDPRRSWSRPPEDQPDIHLYIRIPYQVKPYIDQYGTIGAALDKIRILLSQVMQIHAVESVDVSTRGFNIGGRSQLWRRQTWIATMASCTLLSHLTVRGPGVHVLLWTLADPLSAATQLPLLRSLKLDEDRLSRKHTHEGAPVYDLLLATLRSHTISSLQIPDSHDIPPEDLDALRAATKLALYHS